MVEVKGRLLLFPMKERLCVSVLRCELMWSGKYGRVFAQSLAERRFCWFLYFFFHQVELQEETGLN